MRRAILTAMILAGFVASRAEAQTVTPCNGRIMIDSVYTTRIGDDLFEYFFVMRNATSQRMMLDVSFSGFPSNVTLFSSILPNVPISPNATVSPHTRLGNGTNNNINMQTVRVVHDAPPPAGAALRLSNCRAI